MGHLSPCWESSQPELSGRKAAAPVLMLILTPFVPLVMGLGRLVVMQMTVRLCKADMRKGIYLQD